MGAALAVRIPGQLGEGAGDLQHGIRGGAFLYCTFSGTRLPGDPVRRWPSSGWLRAPAGHGNAGLASNFVDLAHAKLRPGGVAAFVLPAAFVQGGSWRNARDLFAGRYQGLTVVSIADTGQASRAFSADTGMAEVLVVARKTGSGKSDTLFANLRRRPRSILEAVSVARRIEKVAANRTLLSTGRIPLPDADEAGVFVRTELQNGGASGILEAGLAQTMLGLARGAAEAPPAERGGHGPDGPALRDWRSGIAGPRHQRRS